MLGIEVSNNGLINLILNATKSSILLYIIIGIEREETTVRIETILKLNSKKFNSLNFKNPTKNDIPRTIKI